MNTLTDEQIEAGLRICSRARRRGLLSYEVYESALLELQERNRPCVWLRDEDGTFHPQCGHEPVMGVEKCEAFCPGCGHAVKVEDEK